MAEYNKNLLTIRLNLFNSVFVVRTPREEEEHYRKAVVLVKSVVNSYSERYKDEENYTDILLRALIDIALRYEQTAGKNDTQPYLKALKELTAEVENALSEEREA